LLKMPDNFIDLIVTSPPYNVNLGKNKYNKNPYDLYRDNKAHKEYIRWLQLSLVFIYQKTKPGGRCAINISDAKNGGIPTVSDVIQFMTQKIGWIPMTNIIWHKSQIGNRCSWGSWKSPSSPSFPTPYENIVIFAKESKKLQWKGETDLTKQEFIDWSLAVWNFPGETKAKKLGHPAPFPIELPKRLIKMLSWIDSIIYDPFMGIGTTALACKLHNRNYIGSEISAEYCRISEKRLLEI